MIDWTAPSVRGAPGALGCCAGSNASERRPGAAGGGRHRSGRLDGGARQAGLRRRSRTAASLDLVLQPLHRRLELLIAVLQLLDRAGELAHLVLELIDLDVDIAAGHLGARRRHGDHASDGTDGNGKTDHHCSLIRQQKERVPD